MENLQGILPAIVTPFDAEDRFSPPTFERLMEALFETGVHGVYVCGQTGEGLLQPPAQRKLVAETAVRCAPRTASVVIHVGAAALEDAIDLARHAAQIQATAISSLPPSGEQAPERILAYYRGLAEASELPLLLYYFPEITPAINNPQLLADLLALPNVIGLKFTDFDLYRLSNLRRLGHVVFNGRDEVLVAGLLMGASGGIGTFYNLVPELFLDVFDLSQRGDWEKAREIQQEINELITITLRFPVLPAVKKILAWSGINCGECLPPNRQLSAEEETKLRDLLLQSEVGKRTCCGLRVA